MGVVRPKSELMFLSQNLLSRSAKILILSVI